MNPTPSDSFISLLSLSLTLLPSIINLSWSLLLFSLLVIILRLRNNVVKGENAVEVNVGSAWHRRRNAVMKSIIYTSISLSFWTVFFRASFSTVDNNLCINLCVGWNYRLRERMRVRDERDIRRGAGLILKRECVFNWLLLVNLMVTFLILVLAPQVTHSHHLQPLATYYANNYNF